LALSLVNQPNGPDDLARNKGIDMRFVTEYFKFQGMRKEQDFVIYPCKSDDSTIWLQSDNRMLKLDLTTGEGMLSKPTRNNGFHSVMEFLGAKKITLAKEELERITKMKELMAGRTNKDGSFTILG
jgi:hypothetical protein